MYILGTVLGNYVFCGGTPTISETSKHIKSIQHIKIDGLHLLDNIL